MSFLHSPCSAVFFRLAGSGLLSNSGVSGMKVTAEDSVRGWPGSVTGAAAGGNRTKGRRGLGADPALLLAGVFSELLQSCY